MRDPTTILLAPPSPTPAGYLSVFLKEGIGWIMATAIHFLFFPSFSSSELAGRKSTGQKWKEELATAILGVGR